MRTTKLNQITLCADGSIGLQLLKIVTDGDNIISKEPHRAVIQPDELSEDALQYVNPHLEEMGFTAITSEEIAHIDVMAAAHRALPSVASGVAAYKQEKADAIAKAERDLEEQSRAEAEAETQRQSEVIKRQGADEERIRQMIAQSVAAALAVSGKRG